MDRFSGCSTFLAYPHDSVLFFHLDVSMAIESELPDMLSKGHHRIYTLLSSSRLPYYIHYSKAAHKKSQAKNAGLHNYFSP